MSIQASHTESRTASIDRPLRRKREEDQPQARRRRRLEGLCRVRDQPPPGTDRRRHVRRRKKRQEHQRRRKNEQQPILGPRPGINPMNFLFISDYLEKITGVMAPVVATAVSRD
jgi:hypothetical protein